MTGFSDAASAAGLKGKAGKQAIKGEYRGKVTFKNTRKGSRKKRAARFTGSVDLDEHFKAKEREPDNNRWDYGVGVKVGDEEFAFWIEPHPASGSDEIAVMIRKLKWLQAKLREPDFKGLADLTKAAQAKGKMPFRWLYKSGTSFRSGGKEQRQLAQHGMGLPERHIQVG